MNIAQAKAIPIEEVLAQEGYQPVKQRGFYLLYHSPLREGDSDPSFHVNTAENTWYDFGLDMGGKIIDYYVYQGMSPGHALGHIGRLFSKTTVSVRKSVAKPQKKTSIQSLKLKHVKELSAKPLLDYLESRKVSLVVAQKYCKEIYFTATDDTGKSTDIYSIGFPNDTGGYEARNLGFKGFVSEQKSITFIEGNEPAKLAIFEGFMDFLSYLTHYQITDLQSSVLVLNSTALVEQALKLIAHQGDKIEKVYFFLDNDDSGRKALLEISENLKCSWADKSTIYENYGDFNEFIVRNII